MVSSPLSPICDIMPAKAQLALNITKVVEMSMNLREVFTVPGEGPLLTKPPISYDLCGQASQFHTNLHVETPV